MYYYYWFLEEDIDTQSLDNFPKVILLISNESGLEPESDSNAKLLTIILSWM